MKYKTTQKDRYGNMRSLEIETDGNNLEVPPMGSGIPQYEAVGGLTENHPGAPKGSDTVPAWLTPGEFVVNKEATDWAKDYYFKNREKVSGDKRDAVELEVEEHVRRSDGLGKDDEMVVHKFVEESIYKWIAYAVLSTKVNTPEHLVQRFKKEKFAETRKAKIRLSNIKLEEITQTLRGRSKQIKH